MRARVTTCFNCWGAVDDVAENTCGVKRAFFGGNLLKKIPFLRRRYFGNNTDFSAASHRYNLPVNNPPDPSAEKAERKEIGKVQLPFLRRYPIFAGALLGLAMRLFFSGKPGGQWAAMTGSFIYLVPLVVGAVTVYLAERTKRRSWSYYLYAPFYACAWFILGTLLIMIEGLICAIVIIPMFACLASVGGIVMGVICRLTNWPRASVYSIASLPITAALLFGHIEPVARIGVIEKSIVIAAPATIVWQEINATRSIPSESMAGALAMRIGVPAPELGQTIEQNGERVRRSSWGKGVYFDEVITDWQPGQYIKWKYRFHPDSFPKHALDDHVVIGGHYFDLNETSYLLEPLQDKTRLTTRTSYRISTHFNFYAQWVAQLVIGNLNERGLALYATRSEAAHAQLSTQTK